MVIWMASVLFFYCKSHCFRIIWITKYISNTSRHTIISQFHNMSVMQIHAHFLHLLVPWVYLWSCIVNQLVYFCHKQQQAMKTMMLMTTHLPYMLHNINETWLLFVYKSRGISGAVIIVKCYNHIWNVAGPCHFSMISLIGRSRPLQYNPDLCKPWH